MAEWLVHTESFVAVWRKMSQNFILFVMLSVCFLLLSTACNDDNGEGDPCTVDAECKADLKCCYGICEAVGDEELCLEACRLKMECRSDSNAADALDKCQDKCRDEPCKRDNAYNGCVVKADDCDGIQVCQPIVGNSGNPEIPL